MSITNNTRSLLTYFQRRDFRDSSAAKPGVLFPFPELWEPIDAEACVYLFSYWLVANLAKQLRGLILLYLTVEKGGASTGKTHIPSINDVLSSGKVSRDKGWVCTFSSMGDQGHNITLAKFPLRRFRY